MTHPALAMDDHQRLDERELIARVLRGDRNAGRVLYDAHAERVHRLAYRMCGDLDMAAEFTQDAFVRAFGQLDRFRGESAFGTWIHRIAVTVTLNGMRKVRRLRDREVDLDHAAPLSTTTRESEPDLKERMAHEIEALPDTLRTTLVMHDIEGFTHQEIAGILGVAEGTSKSRLFDARRRLRVALAEFATE
jgi:RNA polymerase sigma-70 factor (ECF subfamily)